MPSQARIATKNRKPEHSRPPYLCTPIRSECCRTPVCVCNCSAKQGSLFHLVREMVGTQDKSHSTPQPHLPIALSVYAGGGRGDCLGSLSPLSGLFVVAEGCDYVEALNEADTIFTHTGKANHGWTGVDLSNGIFLVSNLAQSMWTRDREADALFSNLCLGFWGRRERCVVGVVSHSSGKLPGNVGARGMVITVGRGGGFRACPGILVVVNRQVDRCSTL